MYQLPVGNVAKIRKSRKAVKNILCDIGLEDCQEFLKGLNEDSEKTLANDEAFEETEWNDFTDGFNGRMQKKWQYRTRSLCCTLCKYSTQNIYNFRSHVSRCHNPFQSFCTLSHCSQCLFIGHPKVLKKHLLYFHNKPREEPGPIHPTNERYQCRKCGIPASSIFAMKKHVILKHLERVTEQYIGYRLIQKGGTAAKVYCCKVCRINVGSLDQLLHHMLMDPSHYTVSPIVQSLIYENKPSLAKPASNGNGIYMTIQNIAPKPQQPQLVSNQSLILPNQTTGTVLTLQQVPGVTSNTTLICAPGTNQAFLPPQASALVQLASAEAKGLLQPGATIALRSALPQGSSMVSLPPVSNVSLQPMPVTLAPPPNKTSPTQQVLIPSGVQASVATGNGTAPKPAGLAQNAMNQAALKGTMLTSQSLLNHLIPTGNRVNGMPTYTFAPLQVAAPSAQSKSTPPKTVEQAVNSPQTKKWITCPLCNELFPSNVFDIHTEAAHQKKFVSAKPETLAARAAFLQKMPNKTVKCLTCKILLSEKSIVQHLLHGLNCLYCSAVFFSIKQLIEHVKQHNTLSKSYTDLLRQKYRIYSKSGGILFPYFDVCTAAPKEVLGPAEVNLALVTNSLDLLYFKLEPSTQPEVSPPVKINSSFCPFCNDKFTNESQHVQHLKQKHFVAPTIHAILKTEAYKCIYCNGVYTGKVTQLAVKLHIQRCRCSPKQHQVNQPKTFRVQQKLNVVANPNSAQPPQQTSGLYFVTVPQNMIVKPSTARVNPSTSSPQRPETEAEMQSKRRLEAALREVMQSKKQGSVLVQEEKIAPRKKPEKLLPEPKPQIDPAVKLALEPKGVAIHSVDERKEFLSKYFNVNPYTTKAESEELCKRLLLNRPELTSTFSAKRSKCMKMLKKNRSAILLGFNMTELKKVKHNLFIPEQQPPPEVVDNTEPIENRDEEPEPVEESKKDDVPQKEAEEPMEVETVSGQ
ncbi:activity-dependent neuroprotector homeobox protein 2b [Gouania willdenowi]|uniref:Activity-dependent neuroprotector homeobox protein 2-like n=1 Tax=Gouania willdenowi TaxID=441366 RepID=A0A8C5DVN4_GOUWI|nr:activity-dependent neuroprotector homeobox protein 2-like [Gouania willdenowi]